MELGTGVDNQLSRAGGSSGAEGDGEPCSGGLRRQHAVRGSWLLLGVVLFQSDGRA